MIRVLLHLPPSGTGSASGSINGRFAPRVPELFQLPSCFSLPPSRERVWCVHPLLIGIIVRVALFLLEVLLVETV